MFTAFSTELKPSIVEALKEALPHSTNVFCWNHIQQDIKYWIKKQKTTDKVDANHVILIIYGIY